jgi:pre-mRNA cleavage complex 2 protein Pcf11
MYSRVGATTRRDMDFILRTWKEPPQGSRDPQPVLPVDITRQIENALIRFRTISFQQNQQQSRTGSRPAPTPKETAGLSGPAEAAEYMTTLQQRPGTGNFHPGAAYQPPQAMRSPVPAPVLPVAQPPPVSYNGAPPNFGAQQPNQGAMLLQSKLQNEMKQIIDVLTLQKVLAVGPPNLEIDQLLGTLNALMKVLNSEALGLPHLQTIQAELAKISDRVQRGMPSDLAMLLKGVSAVPQPQSLPAQAPVPTSQIPFAALLSVAPSYPLTSTPPPLAGLPPAPPTTLAHPAPYPASYAMPTAFQGANPPPPQQGGELDLISQLQAAGLLPPTNPAPSRPVQKSTGGRYGVGLDQESIMRPYVTSGRDYVRLTSQTTPGPDCDALRRRQAGPVSPMRATLRVHGGGKAGQGEAPGLAFPHEHARCRLRREFDRAPSSVSRRFGKRVLRSVKQLTTAGLDQAARDAR